MAFDFPNSPTNGQTFTPAGGPTYTYDSAGTKWTVGQISATVPISTGSYTPTVSAGTNVAATTALNTQYLRVADVVTVSGQCDIDPISLAATTTFGVSLPIASDFTGALNCQGVMTAPGFTETGYVTADVTNNQASLTFQSATQNNHVVAFIFLYRVL